MTSRQPSPEDIVASFEAQIVAVVAAKIASRFGCVIAAILSSKLFPTWQVATMSFT